MNLNTYLNLNDSWKMERMTFDRYNPINKSKLFFSKYFFKNQ